VQYSEESDQALLDQLKLDNNLAFATLFDRYWKRMYRAAHARLSDPATAEDIVQDIFIKLWQRRQVLNIAGPLENYLLSAVRLSVLNHYRSQKLNTVVIEEALDRIMLLEDSLESLTDYIELEKTLALAVTAMPAMLKKVYELRSENRSIKEIAKELGLADQTVKNYIAEVIRRLRIVIVKEYPEKSLHYLPLLFLLLHQQLT
jgi:RNA polymerase sigma factor (sigma-70 family)